MLSQREVQRMAYECQVPEQMIERDYVLTRLLGVLASPRQTPRLVAKGGTALKKLYFADWRYSEDLDFTVVVYTLEEICAEKLRTLLQRTEPRDLYDAWRILSEQSGQIDAQQLESTLRAKCEHRRLSFTRASAILSTERVARFQGAWERRLGEQMPDIPSFESVARETRRLLRTLLD